MSKIKVSTLTGPLLDYWVGRCDDDSKEYLLSEDGRECLVRTGVITAERYSPSTNPAEAYPIIEREIIGTYADSGWREDGEYGTVWEAHALSWGYMDGDTPIIAAMRAFVASKFGEEVDEA